MQEYPLYYCYRHYLEKIYNPFQENNLISKRYMTQLVMMAQWPLLLKIFPYKVLSMLLAVVSYQRSRGERI